MNSEVKKSWSVPGLKGPVEVVKKSVMARDIPEVFKAAICESIPADAQAVEIHAHAVLTDKRFQMHFDVQRLF